MLIAAAAEKFLLYLEAKGNSERTIRTYAQRLRLFFQALGDVSDLVDVTPEMVDGWIVVMRKGLAKDTVRSRVRDIKTFFRFCVARGYLDRSPAEHMKLPGGRAVLVVKAIDRDDLRKMFEAAEYERDRALLIFTASTGCRAGEVAGLRKSQLDLVAKEAQVSGKTGGRWVDFNQEAAVTLRAWLRVHPAPTSDFVFVGLRSPYDPMSADSIYQTFRRIAIRAGVEGRFNPHSIRHLVGQMWTDNANLELARQKLGHKSINTTMAYANQDRTRLKAYTEQLDPVAAGESESGSLGWLITAIEEINDDAIEVERF